MLSMGRGSVQTCTGVTRRDFLRVGGLGLAGLSLTDVVAARAAGGAALDRDRAVILLMLVGGPSQFETWDPKPEAASTVRGPFRPIATSVPGIRIGEHFPRMARMAERYAIVRSIHHDAAPIHEAGHQLMQTGWLFRNEIEYPHVGAVVGRVKGAAGDLPAAVTVPAPIGNTGVGISHGGGAGYLGPAYEPVYVRVDTGLEGLLADVDRTHRELDRAMGSEVRDPGLIKALAPAAKEAYDLGREADSARDRYGRTTFGQSCLLARRLVERGVRLVTVNMFDTVFNTLSWDCHGSRPFSTFDDYRRSLCPQFDRAYAALLADLEVRGLLDHTLVVATGEFGRTARINGTGGRDHWPGVWSMLLAGGGVQGGRTVGASDPTGSEPADRPVRPAEIAATIYQSLGIDPAGTLPGPNGEAMPLVDRAEPIRELLA